MKINIEKLKEGKSMKDLLEFGIINIDKSSGPTSFDVSEFVMKTLGLRKTSHFGTLDPKVTGVLPIALNRACKLTGYFLGEDKEYVGVMKIHEYFEKEDIEKAIKDKFLGVITQLPPVKSRVKREERQREVKKFELLEQEKQEFLFEVECEGGTYIRKLVHDLGQELEVGAHMLELRRIRAGIFKEECVVNLYEFEKAVEEWKKGSEEKLRSIIIPAEIVSLVYPAVEIKKEDVDRILHGAPISKNSLVKFVKMHKDAKISVFCGEKFIGMFKVVNSGEIFAKSEFVMQEIR